MSDASVLSLPSNPRSPVPSTGPMISTPKRSSVAGSFTHSFPRAPRRCRASGSDWPPNPPASLSHCHAACFRTPGANGSKIMRRSRWYRPQSQAPSGRASPSHNLFFRSLRLPPALPLTGGRPSSSRRRFFPKTAVEGKGSEKGRAVHCSFNI